MYVYVSSIRSGTAEDFTAVHTTEEAAWADLARWARAYWTESIDGPMPDDDDAVIDRLYDHNIDLAVEGPIEVDAPYMPRGPRRPVGEADPEQVAKLHAQWVAHRRG